MISIKKYFLIFSILTCLFFNLSSHAYGQEQPLEQPEEVAEKESISAAQPPDQDNEVAADETKILEQENAINPTIPLQDDTSKQPPIFDDKRLLDGFAETYSSKPLDTLLAMIEDDTLDPYRLAAAVRAFKNTFAHEVFAREKRIIEKTLLRRLNRSDSAFVQVEIMHTLCQLDRYRYFGSMAPALILKMDHYNSTVNELAYNALDDIIASGNNRAREARIVFNTLRKVLFLSRKRLANVTEPSPRLKQKLELVRWSVKVLGNQELKRLPKEVIDLL